MSSLGRKQIYNVDNEARVEMLAYLVAAQLIAHARSGPLMWRRYR